MDLHEGEAYLGACPRCSAHIPAPFLIIRYEDNLGSQRVFAKCPECEEIVHPY